MSHGLPIPPPDTDTSGLTDKEMKRNKRELILLVTGTALAGVIILVLASLGVGG